MPWKTSNSGTIAIDYADYEYRIAENGKDDEHRD